MGHYARINDEGIVQEVIVAKKEFIETGVKGDPSKWIKTSYNTHAGEHYDREKNEYDGTPGLRKNYAGAGYKYDKDRDAFIPPKPFPSWVLNETTCRWDAPVAEPSVSDNIEEAGFWHWNEEELKWELKDQPHLPY